MSTINLDALQIEIILDIFDRYCPAYFANIHFIYAFLSSLNYCLQFILFLLLYPAQAKPDVVFKEAALNSTLNMQVR
jgi:hypothetical protein